MTGSQPTLVAAYLAAARRRDDREARLAATWRGRLTLRVDAMIRSVRRRWEYWNSSTQRQIRRQAGYGDAVALTAVSAAAIIGLWIGFIDSLHR